MVGVDEGGVFTPVDPMLVSWNLLSYEVSFFVDDGPPFLGASELSRRKYEGFMFLIVDGFSDIFGGNLCYYHSPVFFADISKDTRNQFWVIK